MSIGFAGKTKPLCSISELARDGKLPLDGLTLVMLRWPVSAELNDYLPRILLLSGKPTVRQLQLPQNLPPRQQVSDLTGKS